MYEMKNDIKQTTTTDFENDVGTYSVDVKTTDGTYSQEKNRWSNPDASTYYGFYYNVGEYRAALNSFGNWVIGQGYEADNRIKVLLDNITGWGEDTFLSVMWNMIVTKKFNGDSYSEAVRNDKGTLINLKVLDPRRMTHITNKKGIIETYEYLQADGKTHKFKPQEILHFCNDRILDEPHGTSVTSAVEWVLTAIEQARRDWKRVMHLSAVRLLYVDENDKTRMAELKTELSAGIKNGDVVIIPCKPEEAKFQDLVVPPAEAWVRYLDYLEDKLYKQLGVPKVVLGGTQDNTEASAKVGVLVYEPVWTKEMLEVQADLWNQLAIKITINKQPSLQDNLKTQEDKNNAQTGFQPSDAKAGEIKQ